MSYTFSIYKRLVVQKNITCNIYDEFINDVLLVTKLQIKSFKYLIIINRITIINEKENNDLILSSH